MKTCANPNCGAVIPVTAPPKQFLCDSCLHNATIIRGSDGRVSQVILFGKDYSVQYDQAGNIRLIASEQYFHD